MRFVVLAVAALLSIACGNDATAPSHAGTYTLVSINGEAVPILLTEDEVERVELTRGEIVLRDDNTFDDLLEFTQTVEGETTTEPILATGTWQMRGNQLTMTYDGGGGVIDGELENGRITQQVGSLRFIYQK